MKKTDTYTQCILVKENTSRVGWIPTEKAVLGKPIRLKIDGKWSSGWVVNVFGGTLPAKYVEEHERDFRNQRKASDV